MRELNEKVDKVMEERQEIREFRDKMVRNKLYMEGDKL